MLCDLLDSGRTTTTTTIHFPSSFSSIIPGVRSYSYRPLGHRRGKTWCACVPNQFHAQAHGDLQSLVPWCRQGRHKAQSWDQVSHVACSGVGSTIPYCSAYRPDARGRGAGHQPPHCNTTTGVWWGGHGSPTAPGQGQYLNPPIQPIEIGESSQFHHMPAYNYYQREVRLPKAIFPKFDGSHPRVWKEKCEKYFNMYQVPMPLWSKFATIHFQGGATLWLQTSSWMV